MYESGLNVENVLSLWGVGAETYSEVTVVILVFFMIIHLRAKVPVYFVVVIVVAVGAKAPFELNPICDLYWTYRNKKYNSLDGVYCTYTLIPFARICLQIS
jgi:hypothetical protein